MNWVPTKKLPPLSEERQEDIWLEEGIWGHRFWDQQTPWLTFLEFLCAAEYAFRQGHLFDFDKSQYPAGYVPYRRIALRAILFNNEHVMQRIARDNPDSNTAWSRWLEWMKSQPSGLDPDQRDFAYLKGRFDSFHDFTQLVRALRSCAVEGDTNKRWSSRFIFPFGPAALFEDLRIDQKGAYREYINFGRTGELLYLMMARSKSAPALAKLFPSRVLNVDNKWNHLIRLLQPPVVEETVPPRGKDAFLPYDQHPNFDLMAADWEALLKLHLPGFDVVPFLVASAGFGLLLYQLHVAAQVAGRDIPPIICEVVAPRRGLVRERSIQNFEDNCVMSAEALEKVISQIEQHPGWHQPGQPVEVLNRRKDILFDRFRWKDESGGSDPDDLLRKFREEAKGRHRRHFGQVHRSFGRGIGLVSRRGTNRHRYAPVDNFLKCLVFCNVERRVEFQEFLDTLFERYGLVFGEKQAEKVLTSEEMDKKPFEANALRLEHRLGSLGLLRRLSDACAYVENPYAG